MASNTRTALFIYGMPGAGKSTVLTIADGLGIPSITMGDVVRERARVALGDGLDSNAIGQWATDERTDHGPQIMAEYTRDEILSAHPDADLVIVEGTRSPREIAVFKPEFVTLTLRITSPFETRLQRLQARGRDGEETFTEVDLEERDQREYDWGLAELFDVDDPDYVIDNTGTLTEYETKLEAVFDDLT
jgi:dephospho-CoA kinase